MPDFDALLALGLHALTFSGLACLFFLPLEHFVGRGRRFLTVDMHFASTGKVLTVLLLAATVGSTLSFLPTLVSLPELAHSVGLEPSLITILVGLVIFDAAGYAYHRLAHRVPALWRLHRVHHSSEEMSFSAGFREHPLEVALLTFVQNAPLVLLGLPLASHLLLVLLLRLHTLFVHSTLTQTSLSLFALPAFHHRHHARELEPANFATLFPWIDRICGTYAAPVGDVRVGIDEEAPKTFWGLLLLRLREPAQPVGSTRRKPLERCHVRTHG